MSSEGKQALVLVPEVEAWYVIVMQRTDDPFDWRSGYRRRGGAKSCFKM